MIGQAFTLFNFAFHQIGKVPGSEDAKHGRLIGIVHRFPQFFLFFEYLQIGLQFNIFDGSSPCTLREYFELRSNLVKGGIVFRHQSDSRGVLSFRNNGTFPFNPVE